MIRLKRKRKEIKELELSDITVFDFKNCYNGDLSFLNNDTEAWNKINEKWEVATEVKGANVVLELQKQIAKKELKIIKLDIYLFMLRNAFQSYTYSLNDVYYLDNIEYCANELIENGIKYNKKNNLIEEHNRCMKLIKNKQNDIKVDLLHLKEATKGSMTFAKLIAIVGKFSGGGLINQKLTTMDEFLDFYNLMIDGKRN